MHHNLPFFNWSLKKAIDTEPDTFMKARIRIIFMMLLLSVLKAAIAVVVATQSGQNMQSMRALTGGLIYVVLTKILLWSPKRAPLLAHIMLSVGAVLIWTNIFVFVHNLNLVTLQFLFMIMISGFYTIGNVAGIVYSIIGVAPVLFYVLSGHKINVYTANAPQELASPGAEIIVVLNFITMIMANYLFYHAFKATIKEKELLNAKLRLSVEAANQHAESRSNFLSTMSHELRTPLNAVIGTTELLIRDSPELRQQENLKILHSSSIDLLSLVNNVLDFNKIDSDKIQLEETPVKLAELVQNICAALKVKANSKQLDFIVEIDEKLRATTVSTDPTRLSQVLYNLVGNAIKFTDSGSVHIKLTCTELNADHVVVRFSVADTGVGISADKHKTIFDAFAQAESNVTRKYGGTGLGLPIVKQILMLFGSAIELDSTPGKGSKFEFSLKLPIVQATITEMKQDNTNDLSHLRILIAEDNEINRMIIKKQFATFNIEPVMVENGALAYDAWVSGQFDAVILDLHMPVADGYDTVRRIRAYTEVARAQTHIVAFTASVNEKEKILEAGFNDYLYKPTNIKDLREKLEFIAGR